MNKGDPKVIEAYQGKKMDDNALYARAIQEDDHLLCKEITNKDRSNECIMKIAMNMEDPGLCEHIEGLSLANICKQDITLAKNKKTR